MLNRIVNKEIFTVFACGVGPTLLVSFFEGVEGIIKFTKGAIAANYIFYYFSAFFVLHLASSIIFFFYSGKIDKPIRNKLKNWISNIGEVADGLLGIYRLVSGIMLSVPIIWKISEPNTLSCIQLAMLLLLSLSFFSGVVCISYLNNKTKAIILN